MSDFVIRNARSADVQAIANLHAMSWRNAYRGLYPDSYLDGDLVSERKRVWFDKFARLNENEFVLIAEDKDELVGFAAVMDKPENGYDALLDNLHVRTDYKGKGIGSSLMKAVAKQLLQTGRKSLYLWVLNGNTAAASFYVAKGGKPEDISRVHIDGKEVDRTRFVWKSSNDLGRI